MATTINTYLKSVKLITAASLSALETAVNTYITTVRDVPEPKTLFVATVEVVGTTTTE